MDRATIAKAFDVENGYITSIGTYQFEPIYTPYYHALVAEGLITDIVEQSEYRTIYKTIPMVGDHEEFPELEDATVIYIIVTPGRVVCKTDLDGGYGGEYKL